MQIYLLEGNSFLVPGHMKTAHASMTSLNEEAAKWVNILREEVDLPNDATPEDWQAKCLEARQTRADEAGDDLYDLDEGDVWFTEMDLQGVLEPTPVNQTEGVDPPYRPRDLRAVPGSTRDIYELANQLGGWVGPNTEEHLAQFLLREAKEAALLADELVRLRKQMDASPAPETREVAKAGSAILDVTKKTVEEFPDAHVIRHPDGRVIALCPLYDTPVCEGQFSFAPVVHRALNQDADVIHYQLSEVIGTVEEYRQMPCKSLATRMFQAANHAQRVVDEMAKGAKPASEPIRCYVAEMKTSAGADYFVTVRCGDREITPYMHKIQSRADYGVAEWNWLFYGGEKPDILAYREEGASADG